MSREKILIRTSWISAIGNTLLSASKIFIGLLSGSLAVLGDGIDSATDVAISIVMIFTAHIINRPPNQKYAYGYEKAESIATKILSLVIFYAGIQMLVLSVRHIFSGEPKELPDIIAVYVTIVSIAGKLLLAVYQYRQGKKINSPLLTANAVNMKNDILISTGVLGGLIFTFVLKLPVLDTITGLLISLYIVKSSISIFMDANIELMDGVKDETVYHKIFEAVEKVPGASNPHRVRSRQIGNTYMIVLDIEA
ncbi:MAG: cation diffusion facilitator family transporter, partial [Prevotellaceae bacterium]|nr:cation diffusion facilitator family transporter [Prevotellaceae bacterium]